jgi:hypothetical protein
MVYLPCMPHDILYETLKYFSLRCLYLVAYEKLYMCVCVCVPFMDTNFRYEAYNQAQLVKVPNTKGLRDTM